MFEINENGQHFKVLAISDNFAGRYKFAEISCIGEGGELPSIHQLQLISKYRKELSKMIGTNLTEWFWTNVSQLDENGQPTGLKAAVRFWHKGTSVDYFGEKCFRCICVIKNL